MWGTRLTDLRWNTDQLVFTARPEARAILPSEWYAEVSLGPLERGIVFRDRVPVKFLRPGVHRLWTVDAAVALRVFRIDEPMPELDDEIVAILPRGEYVHATIIAHQRGLKFVRGELVEILPPGRYAFWSHPEAEVLLQAVDMRSEQVSIVGQELMTRDKVTLRLTLTVEYAIEDPATVVTSVANVRDAIYLIVQLAAREFVAGVSLDELLEGRDSMARFLEEDAVPKARRFGVRVERVGLKDVVLPGEMKTLLEPRDRGREGSRSQRHLASRGDGGDAVPRQHGPRDGGPADPAAPEGDRNHEGDRGSHPGGAPRGRR